NRFKNYATSPNYRTFSDLYITQNLRPSANRSRPSNFWVPVILNLPSCPQSHGFVNRYLVFDHSSFSYPYSRGLIQPHTVGDLGGRMYINAESPRRLALKEVG